MIVRGARAFVIAAAVAWLVYVWRFSAAAPASGEVGRVVINGMLNAIVIQQLKMQGVETFGDFALVLRLKLMTKPGSQFAIARRAFMMMKKAFDENGIKIAVPTVHVDGGGETAAAAHQVQQTMKNAQAVEAAAREVTN